jgi:Holliday junction resolvasome RuvABC endonuclease subunit
MAKKSQKNLTTVLGLDLSTTSTGFALIDADTKGLLKYGCVVPKVAGLSKLKYPRAALARILYLAQQISDLVKHYNPDQLVIEEVNRGIQRISQKSLDALHFFVLHYIDQHSPHLIDSLYYYDSDGRIGWRKHLNFKLTDEDKAHNAHIKTFKSSRKVGKKKPKITKKHLAQRYVEQVYNLKLDIDVDSKNEDICDAIAMTNAYLLHVNSKT